MNSDTEKRFQELDHQNSTDIAGEYFARIFIADDREQETEVVREELFRCGEIMGMSSIYNAIWAKLQIMLEESIPSEK